MTDNSDIPDRAVSPPGAVPAYERRNWPRRLLRPVLAVVVLLAVLAAGGFVLARHYEGELRRTSLAAPATHRMGPATARRQKTPSSNYLLVGSDTRAARTARSAAPTPPGSGQTRSSWPTCLPARPGRRCCPSPGTPTC